MIESIYKLHRDYCSQERTHKNASLSGERGQRQLCSPWGPEKSTQQEHCRM